MGRIRYGQQRLSLGEKVALVIKAQQLPEPEREYRFHPTRKWRFDFAWILGDHRIALEIEGGVFIRGRHTQGAGYAKDAEKYNQAALLGWRIYRVTTKQLSSWSKIRNEVSKVKGLLNSL